MRKSKNDVEVFMGMGILLTRTGVINGKIYRNEMVN